MSKKRKKNQYKNIGTNNLNYTNKLREDDVVIILQDIEFAWNKKDISKVKKMWDENYSFKEILKEIKREGDELFLLLLHLARRNQIKEREGFIWGKWGCEYKWERYLGLWISVGCANMKKTLAVVTKNI